MRLFVRWLSLFRCQFRSSISLLLLVSVSVLLTVLLAGPAGVAASKVLFQSPAATPTLPPTNTPAPVPTDTPMPSPTDTPMPAPSDTPQPTSTAVLPPTDKPPAAGPSPTTPPPTDAPTATVVPTSGPIQMPLLPPTATPESLSSASEPTPTPKQALSPGFVGWIVVVAILALAAVMGFLFGGALRKRV